MITRLTTGPFSASDPFLSPSAPSSPPSLLGNVVLVLDETQDLARAYDAVCTPDFFGFDSSLELRYHGRLDQLVQAMTVAAPAKPINSIGCSIKWKKK